MNLNNIKHPLLYDLENSTDELYLYTRINDNQYNVEETNYNNVTAIMVGLEHCKYERVLLLLISKCKNLDSVDKLNKNTSLMYGFRYCQNERVLQELINKVTNKHYCSNSNMTALMYAIKYCKFNNLVYNFIDDKCRVDIIIPMNETALMYAAKYANDRNIIIKISSLKCLRNHKNNNNKTAYDCLKNNKYLKYDYELSELLKVQPMNLCDKILNLFNCTT
jgi:hypothetical protein